MVKKILVIDGGGVKGIIVLQFLKHLEISKNIKVSDYFDIFAGTSTGALIAVLFAYKKYTASQILESVYTLPNIQKIMHQGYYNWALSTFQFRAKYEDMEKKRFIAQFIEQNWNENEETNKDVYLSDIDKPILITAYSPIEKVPILFRNYFNQPNYLLRDACNATSAAPTYFPIAEIECPVNCQHSTQAEKMIHSEYPTNDSFSLKSKEDAKGEKGASANKMWAIDGGVFSNNPSDLIYLDALELYPNEEFKILSIGTGITKSNLQNINNNNISMGGLGWIIDDNIIDLLLDSNQVASHIKTKKIAKQKGHDYLRVNEYLHFASNQMDDTSEKNYQKLKEEGDLWWRLYQNTDFIRNI